MSVTMQLQRSVLMSVNIMIPLEIMAMSLVWAAARHHVDVQRVCITSPAPYWMDSLESCPHPLTCGRNQESCVATTGELALVAGVLVSQPHRHECQRGDPASSAVG